MVRATRNALIRVNDRLGSEAAIRAPFYGDILNAVARGEIDPVLEEAGLSSEAVRSP